MEPILGTRQIPRFWLRQNDDVIGIPELALPLENSLQCFHGGLDAALAGFIEEIVLFVG
jgi:hypothetical protein